MFSLKKATCKSYPGKLLYLHHVTYGVLIGYGAGWLRYGYSTFSHSCRWLSLRMVRSAHLALSLTCFTAQFDFAVSDRYSYEKIHSASLGTARWADLSTRHHIKPSPKGSGLMWSLVLRWAHLSIPTMTYAYYFHLSLCIRYTWYTNTTFSRYKFIDRRSNV